MNKAELIDELRAYEGKEDLIEVLESTSVSHAAARVVLYLAIQVCSADGELHEIKSPLILQPGPAALTDGLDRLHTIIAGWAARWT